ncbi:MAG: glycosyl hydrolase family 18 protein, partial [Endomicrobia bacterium]|nr:glycosyl hydrolase family 18 protein [Endomicrobiia bacterium]
MFKNFMIAASVFFIFTGYAYCAPLVQDKYKSIVLTEQGINLGQASYAVQPKGLNEIVQIGTTSYAVTLNKNNRVVINKINGVNLEEYMLVSGEVVCSTASNMRGAGSVCADGSQNIYITYPYSDGSIKTAKINIASKSIIWNVSYKPNSASAYTPLDSVYYKDNLYFLARENQNNYYVVKITSGVQSESKGGIAMYLPSYRSLPTGDQLDKMTHLILSFGIPDANFTVRLPTSGWARNDTTINNVVANAHEKKVKVILALGGAAGTGTFPESVKEANRQKFVNDIVSKVNKYDFDGVDIDWEYPGWDIDRWRPKQDGGAELKDFENFMILLRQQLGSDKRLSFAVSADFAVTFYSTTTLNTLDALHVMTYDGETPSRPHHAEMAWAKSSVNKWITSGRITPDKVFFGIPFYGKTVGDAEEMYSEIIKPNPAVLSQTNFNGVYYYDGIPQVKEKTVYAWDRGAGGVMVWELGQDVASTSTYSLLNAIHQQTRELSYGSMDVSTITCSVFASLGSSPSKYFNAIAAVKDHIYVYGSTAAPSSTVLPYVVKYDLNGANKGERTYNIGNDGAIVRAAVYNDVDIYVLCRARSGNRYDIIKMNDINSSWNKNFNGLNFSSLHADQAGVYAGYSSGDKSGYQRYDGSGNLKEDKFVVATATSVTQNDSVFAVASSSSAFLLASLSNANAQFTSIPTGERNSYVYNPDGQDYAVTPSETLKASDTFTYKVKYVNYRNEAPASGYPKLYVYDDGVCISTDIMNLESSTMNYTGGRVYFFQKGLIAKPKYSYKIEMNYASDSFMSDEYFFPKMLNVTIGTIDTITPAEGRRNTTVSVQINGTN